MCPAIVLLLLTSVLSKERFPWDITYVADTESYRELLLPWIKASIRYRTNPLGLLVQVLKAAVSCIGSDILYYNALDQVS
jgi:hypothetical protein